ncbi:MAG: transposase [Betaproteobacteria bacterium]|nr:transposase [Betaproteobacteria bacterium]
MPSQDAVLFAQTFGDLANFNPHLHVLAADGGVRCRGHVRRASAGARSAACRGLSARGA